MDRPAPRFSIGQRVPVLSNDRNRTLHEGTIREALWRDGRWVDAESFAILDRDYFASRTS